MHLTLNLVTSHSPCLKMSENERHVELNLLSGILIYSDNNICLLLALCLKQCLLRKVWFDTCSKYRGLYKVKEARVKE